MTKKPILFLYISISSGHQRAAEAIMRAIHSIDSKIKTIGIDSFTQVYPIMGRLVGRAYLEMLRRTPQLWSYLYDNPDVEEATRELRDILNFFNSFKIDRLIKKYNPRCLVCTQAAPLNVISSYIKRSELNIPVIGVITDFAVHKYWISKGIDMYLASTVDAKKTLMHYGIEESRIYITGIPIDPRFAVRDSQMQEKERLGFDPKVPVIMIMGGSRGMGPIADVVDVVKKAQIPFQIIVICGKNKRMLQDLKWKFRNNKKIKLFGFTKVIHKIIDSADLIITKPGGLSSSEALAKGVPMIMIRPIPGQEERNSDYLLKNNAAIRADNLSELTEIIHELFTHSGKIEVLKENALAISKPYAATDAAAHILNLAAEKNIR